MRLVVIQCAESHHHNLAGIFNEININTYSEIEVDGYMKNIEGPMNIANWFGSEKLPYKYIVSMVFLQKEKAKLLLERIHTFNENEERISPINAYSMCIDEFV